jgi:2-phospho-L-lactate transferase/gluconeogenesis factor (CofD/UPF0052 family)
MPFNIGGGTGIVSVINSGVLFFAALLLAWTTVFGIVNTANDGEALGQKVEHVNDAAPHLNRGLNVNPDVHRL